ncbi:YafY family transcriptional regulator [Pseudenhygromyxa sp. WMMC2535]|uniref:helix-turn-helix transcriptional regulator n=1 Tax=Pseudenhygromyxa sp. WMMC2535 TaxID=2712867 RepID=UPI001556ADFB|nr:YafY family protein [Pseudenhygromyxa sp. WMMC2535]NVB43113.1 YafY family transcriptional regulator [Pseudenhygromyxa sp. WMMC2535]
MLDTSARLLRLLALLQSQRFWAGTDLAARLEVTPRTVRRDVERLRSLGYPVASSSGVAGGYQLEHGSRLPPLLLDDDEALAMSVGLRGALVTGVEGLEEASLRAMTKLEQVMPQRLRGRLAGFHRAIAQLPLRGPSVSSQVLGAIAQASWSDKIVRFAYVDGASQRSSRIVEPHGLVHLGGRWYLAAFDRKREDWRTFRVDRIDGKVREGERFVRREPPGKDLVALVSRSVSGVRSDQPARVIIHAPYDRVRAKVPALAAHVSEIDAQRCLLETSGGSFYHLALHIGLLGEDFEVQSPPELQAVVERLAGTFGRAAGRGESE